MKKFYIHNDFLARVFFGSALLYGSVVHWLIIFGVLQEKAPFVITVYFHSLAILDALTGFGILAKKRWALFLGLFIGVTQVVSHVYMLWLDYFHAYMSGLTYQERLVDIIFSVLLIAYCLFYRASTKQSLKDTGNV